jgi:hypothetical protein
VGGAGLAAVFKRERKRPRRAMELAPPPPIRGESKLRRPNAVWSCMHLETGFEAAAPRPPASTDALSASGHLSTRAWGASPLCRDLQWDAWWGQPTPAVVVSAMTEAIHPWNLGRRAASFARWGAARGVQRRQRRAETCGGVQRAERVDGSSLQAVVLPSHRHAVQLHSLRPHLTMSRARSAPPAAHPWIVGKKQY